MRALAGPMLAALALFASPMPAQAHPHVWITARADLVYAPDGRLSAVRHAWTFDESYSAFATQGLAAGGRLDPEAARDLARTNMESLADSGYFTRLRIAGARQAFDEPRDAAIGLDGDRLTLRFTLPLKQAAAATRVMLDVVDPTFFVEFAFAEGNDAVRLEAAPAGCRVSVQRPKPMAPSETAPAGAGNLSDSLFSALTGAGGTGGFGNRGVVTCP